MIQFVEHVFQIKWVVQPPNWLQNPEIIGQCSVFSCGAIDDVSHDVMGGEESGSTRQPNLRKEESYLSGEKKPWLFRV